MKRFLIEIEDKEWEKIIGMMRTRYSTSDPLFLVTSPPVDSQVFEDYLYALWADFDMPDMADFTVQDVASMVKRDINSLVLTPPSPYSTAIPPSLFQESIKGEQVAGIANTLSDMSIPLPPSRLEIRGRL